MTPTRRHFLHGLAAVAGPLASVIGLSGLSFDATAQTTPANKQEAVTTWPQHPVHVISPYGPGGSNDISARLLSEALSKRLGQPFIIENKPGAGTRVANDYVAHAPADGTVFLFAAAPFATVESIYGTLSYDPLRDFKPVTLAVIAPVFLVVNASSPIKTVADLVAYGKAKPEGLTFASPGSGSGPHLTAELLFKVAGVKGLNVQYRGDATAYTDLLAGRVDATLTAIPTGLPFIQQGKLRVIAVASEERSPVYPGVSTFKEQGFPDIVGYGWFGFMAPSRTPDAVIDKLAREVNAVVADPVMRDKLLAIGTQPRGGSPADFAAFIRAETVKWGAVVKSAGIKPE